MSVYGVSYHHTYRFFAKDSGFTMDLPSPIELEDSMAVHQQPALEQTIITAATKLPCARRVKRRATKACQSCRLRKVRCNVQAHGIPCLNCSMDDVNCVISAQRRKRQATSSTGATNSKTSPSPSSLGNNSNEDSCTLEKNQNGSYHDERNSSTQPRQNVFPSRINDQRKPESGIQNDEPLKDWEVPPGDKDFGNMLHASITDRINQLRTYIKTTSKQGRVETKLVDYLMTSLESPDDFDYPNGNTYVSASHDSKYDVPGPEPSGPEPSRASRPHFSSDTVIPPTTKRSFHRTYYPSFTSSEQVHRPAAQKLLHDCYAVAAAASKAIETALLYTDLHVCEQVSRNCNCKCSCAFSNINAISSDNPGECYPSPHASFAAQPPDLFPREDLEPLDKPERFVTREDLRAVDVDAFSSTRTTISGDSDEAVPVDFQLDLPIADDSFDAMADFGEDIDIGNSIKASSY
ncbi:hypothetical protein VF21_09554 [Pseudogymnoascus sp. 05NY08]|nr:hypothetical protein VF21_09554 [Pseudogymnoascus sp. 05NY08]